MAHSSRFDHWEVSARSETGYVRETNEDRMGAFQIGDARLYVVADGMGGHCSGAQAAELTVLELHEALILALPQMSPTEALRTALASTNKRVYAAAHCGDPGTHKMGSTVVLLLVVGQTAHIAHVGDSRAYLFQTGTIMRLTRDHSAVQRMIDNGELTISEARGHPLASAIERAIGDKPEVEATLPAPFLLNPGDAIVLCSDGLCGFADDEEIEGILRSNCSVQEVADRLVGLALEKGGRDNVTVQFIQYGARKEAYAMSRKQSAYRTMIHRIRRSGPRLALVSIVVFLGLFLSGVFLSTYRDAVSQSAKSLETWFSKETETNKAAEPKMPSDDTENVLKEARQLAEANQKQISALQAETTMLRNEIEQLKKKPVKNKRAK